MDKKMIDGGKQNSRGEQTEAAKEYPLEGLVKTDGMVCEALAAYLPAKKQGEFTVEDLANIPDEQRVELIDGVIFEMEAPYTIHQTIELEIFARLRAFIMEKGGKCVPFAAPVDVQLDCDNKTMLQPDVMVICDREKNNGKRIYGAPDFIAEVLSKSTRKKDLLIKTVKYENAGVRECWMIDPDKKQILVYDFEREGYPVIYGFDDEIPVRIFEGECKINFREIHDYLKEIYGV
ncbi:hypothetical protein BRYFOR_06021 [Marvinbryantia formatexigens DSM 14469]|uniref:Putative restriction endonuclease domain-containing protein n=1 Tax=Marvinbryantia formatexigens DSM 14469 TaxID=478749 RepID=C6LBM6_9FIRM|nr:Uma2 family endonuclease [Marvinbryantia formatexigens]EET61829.1 hypothetical protein BRYFOR_06021 [Marvinbryantia formatexigens DSM 14469]UWO25808.1 Uma2 family endonuclease [Marvinbryantia formatexigens DSM 14469]SDF37984.1 Endonuclease, Uma2 family (restriction endonuclease fold) [Marvinbryantia formatexigens]